MIRQAMGSRHCAIFTFVTETKHFVGSLFLRTGALKTKCNYGIFEETKLKKPHTFVRLQWGRSQGPPEDSRRVSVTHECGADTFFVPETENCAREADPFCGIFGSARMECLFSSETETDAPFLYEKIKFL